jgi:5-methylcytosine-specific restriction endonuclease McrA
MPNRAPKACPRTGCTHYQPCPDHAPASWSTGMHGRPMPRHWATTRRRILRRDGYQCRLKLTGCIGTATEVHHTQPGNEADAYLLAACPPCHRQITQQQAGPRRRENQP